MLEHLHLCIKLSSKLLHLGPLFSFSFYLPPFKVFVFKQANRYSKGTPLQNYQSLFCRFWTTFPKIG